MQNVFKIISEKLITFTDTTTHTQMPKRAAAEKVTTWLENVEMSGNFSAVRDFTKCQGSVREKISPEKSCLKLLAAYLCPYRYLVGVCSVLNIKYMVSDQALLNSYPHH